MLIPLLGLVLGILIGFRLPVYFPVTYARYISIGLLAAMDTAFGGMRASLEGRFDTLVFVSGFFSNTLLAAALTYIGDRLGVELYYAALFALGYRVFQNLGLIRYLLLKEVTGHSQKTGKA